jgi:hypothetical protein
MCRTDKYSLLCPKLITFMRIEARVMTGYLTRKQKIFLHKHHKQARLTYSNFRIHMHAHGTQCSSYLESELLIKILSPCVTFCSAQSIFHKGRCWMKNQVQFQKRLGQTRLNFRIHTETDTHTCYQFMVVLCYQGENLIHMS